MICCIIQASSAFLQLPGTPWSKGKQICPYQQLTPWRNTSLERESEQEGSRTSPSLFLAKQAGVHKDAVPFGSRSEALLSPCHTFHGNFCSTTGSEACPLGQQHLSIALPICSPCSSALYMHLEGHLWKAAYAWLEHLPQDRVYCFFLCCLCSKAVLPTDLNEEPLWVPDAPLSLKLRKADGNIGVQCYKVIGLVVFISFGPGSCALILLLRKSSLLCP